MTFILLIIIRNGIVVPSIFPDFFVCWNILKFYLMIEKIRTMIWFEFSFSELVWPLTVFCMSENQIRSLPCSLFTEFELFFGFFDVIFERFWIFVSFKLSSKSATSMLVTEGGDETWRQLWRRFRHQNALSFNIGVGHPHSKDINDQNSVTNIKLPSSTCHQHLCSCKIIWDET